MNNEQSKTAHTARNWRVQPMGTSSLDDVICNIETDYAVVAEYVLQKDADIIVRAVNAHDDLVAALQALFDADMEHCMRGDGKDDQLSAIALARAAIAKATATQPKEKT